MATNIREALPADIGGSNWTPMPTLPSLATIAGATKPPAMDAGHMAANATISNISLPTLASNPVTLEGSFVRPDLTAYDQQYQQAFQQSRAGVANQLSRAMQDVQANENLANQAIATLNPRFQQVFGDAQNQAQQFAGGLADAANAWGMGGRIGAGGLSPEMVAALQGARGTFESTTPLIQLGSQQFANQQRTALEAARTGAEADIMGKEQEWIGRRAELDTRIKDMENQWTTEQNRLRMAEQERRDRAAQAAAEAKFRAEAARAEDRRHRESLAAQSRAERDPIADYRAKAEIDAEIAGRAGKPPSEGKLTLQSMGKAVGAAKGQLISQEDPKLATEIRKSQDYNKIRDEIYRKWPRNALMSADPQQVRQFILDRAGDNKDRTASLLELDILGDRGIQLGLTGLQGAPPPPPPGAKKQPTVRQHVANTFVRNLPVVGPTLSMLGRRR